MILCTDVHYVEDKANAVGLLFNNWEDDEAAYIFKEQITGIAGYIPGEFYKRELPCLLKLYSLVNEPVEIIIIDGFVWLDEGIKKGLGAYLYEALNKKIPIIGVAKTFFRKATHALPLLRGNSQSPLYISSAGIDPEKAAQNIRNMYGSHRIPNLLKQVDRETRIWEEGY